MQEVFSKKFVRVRGYNGCYFVIASDRRERGNLVILTKLLRRFLPRNDKLIKGLLRLRLAMTKIRVFY